jgi:hypothetical protein
MEAADTQLSMLTELVRHSSADRHGFIPLRREDLVGALELIREAHRRELQALPLIAGRLLGVVGG